MAKTLNVNRLLAKQGDGRGHRSDGGGSAGDGGSGGSVRGANFNGPSGSGGTFAILLASNVNLRLAFLLVDDEYGREPVRPAALLSALGVVIHIS